MTYSLGIDVGTTFTAAALWRDGRAETVQLGDRSNAVPSVLFLRADGELLVGEAANRRAVTDPGRIAREFKRRIGDEVPLLLGGQPVTPQALTGEMIRWVVARVTEREGGPPAHVTLTYPANWTDFRRDLIAQAATGVGLADVGLLTEPVAAAIYYAAQERLEPGDTVGVYDLGGGTFDATVLRRTGTGFELLGQPAGDEHLGGIDFDQAVMDHLVEALGDQWERLDLTDPAVLGAVAQVRAHAVEAKEALSTDVETGIPVILPGITREVRLTRAELEEMVRQPLLRSIATFNESMVAAGVEPRGLRAILLVGGSSRIPLVAELIASEVGVPVAVDAHPKFAVCLGAAIAAAPRVAAVPEIPAPGAGQPRTPTRAARALAAAAQLVTGAQHGLTAAAVEADPTTTGILRPVDLLVREGGRGAPPAPPTGAATAITDEATLIPRVPGGRGTRRSRTGPPSGGEPVREPAGEGPTVPLGAGAGAGAGGGAGEHTTILPRVEPTTTDRPEVPDYELRRRAGGQRGRGGRRQGSPRVWAGVYLFAAAAVIAAAGAVWLLRGNETPAGGGGGSGSGGGDDGGQQTATWAKLADLPEPLEAGAVASFKGRLWVAGGVGPATDRPLLRNVQVFDPKRERWSAGPELPVPTSHAALVAADDGLYLVGGLVKDGATANVYRLTADGKRWEPTVPLPAPRGAGAAAWDGGRIVFAGGVRPDHAAGDEVWAFEAGGWRLAGRLQKGREKLAAATDGFGTVYFLAGRDPSAGELGLVDVVSVTGVKAGKQVEALAAPGALFIPGAGVCLVGGQTGDGFSDHAACLNQDKSASVPRLGTARAGLGTAIIDGVVYAVGGYGEGFHGSGITEALTTETP